jgi:hypothetical protein
VPVASQVPLEITLLLGQTPFGRTCLTEEGAGGAPLTALTLLAQADSFPSFKCLDYRTQPQRQTERGEDTSECTSGQIDRDGRCDIVIQRDKGGSGGGGRQGAHHIEYAHVIYMA